jgi:hypothetical protein
MEKIWAEEMLEKDLIKLQELNEKSKLYGSHPSRNRKIEEVTESVEGWGKILKNQHSWSKKDIANKIKRFNSQFKK